MSAPRSTVLIFNIQGNRYRLITRVTFGNGRIYVKDLLTHAEYERLVERLEELDFPDREPTAEEKAVADLLAKLISDYEDRRYPIPEAPPRLISKLQAKKLAQFFHVSVEVFI